MRLSIITSASALAFLLAASPVYAQDRWTVEVRGGANVNSNQFGFTWFGMVFSFPQLV